MLEFNYMLLRGYDFCELYQNTAAGHKLPDRISGATSLREPNSDGANTTLNCSASPARSSPILPAKMGKSEGNAVWINDEKLPAYDYYQYFRNIGDSEVGKCLRIYTDLPLDEIRRLEALKDQEINEAKKFSLSRPPKSAAVSKKPKRLRKLPSKPLEQGGIGGELPTLEKDCVAGLSVLICLSKSALRQQGEVRP